MVKKSKYKHSCAKVLIKKPKEQASNVQDVMSCVKGPGR